MRGRPDPSFEALGAADRNPDAPPAGSRANGCNQLAVGQLVRGPRRRGYRAFRALWTGKRRDSGRSLYTPWLVSARARPAIPWAAVPLPHRGSRKTVTTGLRLPIR